MKLGYAPAAVTDPLLVNPWGISFGPTSPFWISDNGAGVSTLHNGAGQPLSLVVSIPSGGGSTDPGVPTGQVFNSTDSDFVVSAGGNSGKAIFLLAGEDGTISGWSPAVDFTHAILAVDKSASGAVYKGLALASLGAHHYLYAANFRKDRIDVFDKDFRPVQFGFHAFHDRKIPQGFAPFNVQNILGLLVVTYAKQDADKEDDVAGPGNGFVDVYLPNGILLSRFAARGRLNSPWGVTLAPWSFGRFGGALLIGNFGDGRIPPKSV